MKAIFIDSENKEIKEIEVTGLSDMQRCVNGLIEQAVTIRNNVIFVDEEGLFKHYEIWFSYDHSRPFAGNGLVIGYDLNTGDEIDTSMDIEEVKSKVTFLDYSIQ